MVGAPFPLLDDGVFKPEQVCRISEAAHQTGGSAVSGVEI